MHTSGYHIDWYKKKSKTKDTKLAEKSIKRKSTSSESDEETPSMPSKKATQSSFYTDFTSPEMTVANSDDNPASGEENDDEIAANEDDVVAEIISDASTNSSIENNQDYISSIDESSRGKDLHILSLVGFIVWLVGLIPGLFYVGGIGFILCVVSLFLLKGQKNKYKGKGFAVAPVAITGAGYLLAAILLLAVSSLFSFGQGLIIAAGLICLIFAGLTAWLLYAYFEQW